ncbi:meiotic from via Salaria 332 [Haematobia irritans]|uniref:meiotic from via Salaria 332 n=1 Tax=Haematobia irritans TaxID=7368 RepID=UPI003F5015DB
MEAQYKLLNKELVEKIQEMRIELSEYRAEIVNLRAQLHGTKAEYNRVVHKCNALARSHLQSYLELLEPKSALLPLLTNGNGWERTTGRSSHMAEELRRTSSIIQTRRSFNSVSPIRSEGERNDDTGQQINTNAIMEEVEEDEIEQICYSIRRTSLKCSDANESAESIHSDETDHEEINNDQSSNIEMVQCPPEDNNPESIKNNKLRDVTNTMEVSSDTAGTRKEQRKDKNNSSGFKQKENITVTRGGRYACTKNCEPSIEEARQTSDIEKNMESYFTSIQETRTRMQNISLTDMSIGSFVVESSSTPRTKSPTSGEANSSRPRRGCTPTSLVEISLSQKLRNETSEKSLGHRGKKKKK